MSMDYLRSSGKAVRRYLPRTRRDDIVAQLSEDLRSQIERREADLDRPQVSLTQRWNQGGAKQRCHTWYLRTVSPPRRPGTLERRRQRTQLEGHDLEKFDASTEWL